MALNQNGVHLASCLCLTIHFTSPDREKQSLLCEIGFNPAITAQNELASCKLVERWDDIRFGIEAVLTRVSLLGHPLPIESDALLFVMASPPKTASDRAVIAADYEFGRRRRLRQKQRDAFVQYQQKPRLDRLACWWKRVCNSDEFNSFEQQKQASELGARLDQQTSAEKYANSRARVESLKSALVTELSDPLQSLFSALFANEPAKAAKLAARGYVAGAMTTVNIAENDLSPVSEEVPLPTTKDLPPNMTLISLDDGPTWTPSPPPPPGTARIIRADTICTTAPEPGHNVRPPEIVQLKGKKPTDD